MGCGGSVETKPDSESKPHKTQSSQNNLQEQKKQVDAQQESEPVKHQLPESEKKQASDSATERTPEPVQGREVQQEEKQVPEAESEKEKTEPVAQDTKEKAQVEQKPKKMASVDAKDVVVKVDESWRNCRVDFESLKEASEYHWWEIIDELCNPRLPKINPQLKRRGWKTIRLFVSSTFRDMRSEREFLVKRVFPELRIWCEERKLRLVDIDLRWGVPKDADSRETLLACLSEIDRCYEENEFPYFLNLLSERYGWVPGDTDVDSDIEEKYKWLPNLSVTAMEIATGAYWSQNPNALYMFRKADFLKKCPNDKTRSIYIGNEEEQNSLNILKGKLREKFPHQVHEYSCSVEGMDGPLMKLGDFDDLGEQVTAHFKRVIEMQYPPDSLGDDLSFLEVQQLEHEAYMIQRSQILYGREDVLSVIMGYIREESGPKSAPLVLVGSPGAGKSAVVAYIAKECVNDMKGSVKTFYHFVGATPGSTDLYRMLNRIWGELLPEENPPTDVTELKRSMETVLETISQVAKQAGLNRVVLLLDALNQMDDEGDTHDLVWLPRSLPGNVRVVVSTLEGRCLDALRSSKPSLVEVPVNPLSVEHRKSVVNGIFAEYNKKLDLNQLNDLVTKDEAGKPLYLSAACEELRVFGNFRQLDKKIAGLAPDLTGLLVQVLKRIEAENGKELVVATLSLIEVSRFGLLETELLELLSASPKVPVNGSQYSPYTDEIERIPLAQWALAYLGLRQFLRPSGGSGEGRLDFHHRTISKAVRSIYLPDNSSKLWWHARLVQYFSKCGDAERKAEELPYHLEQIGDKERMKACLLEWPIFTRLYAEDRKMQLLRFWRFAGGYNVAATEMVKNLKEYTKAAGATTFEEEIKISATVIAWFIIDLGEYKIAENLLMELETRVHQQEGENARVLCDILYPLVHLYFIQAIKVVYNTSPVYRHCCKQGAIYTDKCIRLVKQYYEANDLHLGKVFLICGYFDKTYLYEAQKVFQTNNFKEGLAQVLYNLGEKEQYHHDIRVPEKTFEESLALCKGVFGYYSAKTARCYQLNGQLYWNQSTSGNPDPTLMDKCLVMYKHELAILEVLLGMTHPTVVRSREDVLIILQTLGRNAEADELLKLQPADKDV